MGKSKKKTKSKMSAEARMSEDGEGEEPDTEQGNMVQLMPVMPVPVVMGVYSERYESARRRAGCLFIFLLVWWILGIILSLSGGGGEKAGAVASSSPPALKYSTSGIDVVTLFLGVYATQSSGFAANPPECMVKMWWTLVILISIKLFLQIALMALIMLVVLGVNDFFAQIIFSFLALVLLIAVIFNLILLCACWAVLSELRKLFPGVVMQTQMEQPQMEEGRAVHSEHSHRSRRHHDDDN